MWFCVQSPFAKKEAINTMAIEIRSRMMSYFLFQECYFAQLSCHEHVLLAADTQRRHIDLLTRYSCRHPRGDVCPFSMCLQFGRINGSQQFDHFCHDLLIQTQCNASQLIRQSISIPGNTAHSLDWRHLAKPVLCKILNFTREPGKIRVIVW